MANYILYDAGDETVLIANKVNLSRPLSYKKLTEGGGFSWRSINPKYFFIDDSETVMIFNSRFEYSLFNKFNIAKGIRTRLIDADLFFVRLRMGVKPI